MACDPKFFNNTRRYQAGPCTLYVYKVLRHYALQYNTGQFMSWFKYNTSDTGEGWQALHCSKIICTGGINSAHMSVFSFNIYRSKLNLENSSCCTDKKKFLVNTFQCCNPLVCVAIE